MCQHPFVFLKYLVVFIYVDTIIGAIDADRCTTIIAALGAG
jgi:hypothetical protein